MELPLIKQLHLKKISNAVQEDRVLLEQSDRPHGSESRCKVLSRHYTLSFTDYRLLLDSLIS